MQIEIFLCFCCRPPHGGRGLKSLLDSKTDGSPKSSSTWRTWIEIDDSGTANIPLRSSSTWRTWIEILICSCNLLTISCRPPHGGRGLKLPIIKRPINIKRSSSTWRTWIEISMATLDTNIICGRPPHGGRGLKYTLAQMYKNHTSSSSTWRTWIEISQRALCRAEGIRVVLHTEDVD